MKKSFLIPLIISFSVMLLGIIVCLVASNKANAEGIDLFASEFNENGEIVTKYTINLEELSKINLVLPEADVEIIGCQSSSYIELVNFHAKTYSLSKSNGLFELDDQFDISSLLNLTKNDFSFNGIRSVLNLGRIFTDKKLVRVHLSGDVKTDLSLTLGTGNVTFTDIEELNDIYVALEQGNVKVHAAYAKSATISISSGNCTVDSSEINKLTTKLHSGDFNYNAKNLEFHNIYAETQNGKISLNGTESEGVTEISNDLAYLNLFVYSIDGNINISK